MQNEMLERDLPPNLAHDPEAWERGAVEEPGCLAARLAALFSAHGAAK